MKVRYQYTNYPYSKSATKWSRTASILTATSIFPCGILLGMVIYYLLGFLGVTGSTQMVLALICTCVVMVVGIRLCKIQEKKCADRDLEKANQSQNG